MENYCCLLSCKKKIDNSTDATVEVKCDPPRRNNSAARRRRWFAQWSPKGEAVFHSLCWKELTKLRLSVVERARVRQAEKTCEFHSSYTEIEDAANRLFQLFSQSKYPVAFTGAGISTSAGIGDFRGKSGKWTEEDRQARGPLDDATNETAAEPEPGVDYEHLRPTLTHELLAWMASGDQGPLLKHVISQNGDGLHQLSGLTPGETLSELHGNVFVERCDKCATRFVRDFYVLDDLASEILEAKLDGLEDPRKLKPHVKPCPRCKLSHRTGRRCHLCRGHLADTIINFNDLLDESVLSEAKKEVERSDLIICLGSTLTVTPASDLVSRGGANGRPRLVICNRQMTDLDAEASLRVFGDCDRFMEAFGRCLMGVDNFQKWLSTREDRLKDYNLKRK